MPDVCLFQRSAILKLDPLRENVQLLLLKL